MKELRVYLVNVDYLEDEVECNPDMPQDDFMELAEQQGTVYTLAGFQNEFNTGAEINNAVQYIRFIEVEV